MSREHTVNYTMLGRKLMRDNPGIGNSYQSEINECKAAAFQNTDLIPRLFILFCQYKDISTETIRYADSRNTQQNITDRRLFIAVIFQLYDQLNMQGFTGRKQDRIVQTLSDVLNCNEKWISQVSESIHYEIKKLSGYQQETQAIIDYLKQNLTAEIEIPQFTNHRREKQLALFD